VVSAMLAAYAQKALPMLACLTRPCTHELRG
jgi:hypothetical protein